MRILVVEDNGDNAEMLVCILKDKGHDVQSVGTADDALRLCVDEHFDLLILDIGLPECDGWELLHRIRAHSGVRAIALTGYGSTIDVDKSRAAGFSAHLTKPVDVETLTRAVEDRAGPCLPHRPTAAPTGTSPAPKRRANVARSVSRA
jgi:CheY-like chemotaxis protein